MRARDRARYRPRHARALARSQTRAQALPQDRGRPDGGRVVGYGVPDDPDEETAPTPRVTGSYLSFQLEAGRMSAEMYASAQNLGLVGPRLDIQGAKQCHELAAALEYIGLQFGLWPQCKSDEALAEDRAYLTLRLARYQMRYDALKRKHGSADRAGHARHVARTSDTPPRPPGLGRDGPTRGPDLGPRPGHGVPLGERPTLPGFEYVPARRRRRDP